jgi:hypothetical protein
MRKPASMPSRQRVSTSQAIPPAISITTTCDGGGA